MEVRAISKYMGISPQKARLVLNEVRGRQAEEALVMLRFMPQQAARLIEKTLKSAIANGVENFGLEAEELYISKTYADHAPNRRWRRFGARGRFKPWIRRSSHITVILEERVSDE